MLERCCGSRVCFRVRANPLDPMLERLAAYLLKRGHGRECIQLYLQAGEHFGRWVQTRRIAPDAVDAIVVRRFLDRHLPGCHCPPPAPRHRIAVRAALRHLLRSNDRQVVLGAAQTSTPPALQTSVAQFDEYMQKVGGLSENTRLYRRRYAREFLQAVFGHGPVKWERITPTLIMKFVADYARRCSPATGQVAAAALSSLLRFAQFRGLCDARLVQAVPTIPVWKRSRTPKSLAVKQVRGVLASFDRTTATGRRDYAMALCMTDLGLRVSEVAALCLEDVNWRQASLRIASSKGRRVRMLPLPRRVGAALSAHLKRGRPASEHRQVFLRLRSPWGQPVSKELVRGVIRRAYAACGLAQSFTGTHILRHTAACLMHQRGVPLKQIADLLGHRSLDSTAVYARANLPQLATSALPWPKGVRP